jgi:hypothetical protein
MEVDPSISGNKKGTVILDEQQGHWGRKKPTREYPSALRLPQPP